MNRSVWTPGEDSYFSNYYDSTNYHELTVRFGQFRLDEGHESVAKPALARPYVTK